jgi:hypothetical protein
MARTTVSDRVSWLSRRDNVDVEAVTHYCNAQLRMYPIFRSTTLVTHISGVQKMLKLGVDVEASVRVSILLVADSIAPFAATGIHNGSGHRYALLIHDEPLRMVDVIPKAGITLRTYQCGCPWGRG